MAKSNIAKLTPKAPVLEYELGVPGDLPFGGGYENSEILPTSEISVQQFRDMRKLDGQVRALMRVITLPIRATGIKIDPGEDGAQEEADFFKLMYTLPPKAGGMSVSFKKFLRQILLALVEGYSVFEEVYQIPTVGPLKDKITLRKAAHRDSPTVRFLVDDHGGFDGFRQKTIFKGRQIDVRIPRETAFYYAANEEENPFYGVSYFHSAYYHWDKKRKLYYLSHIAAQFHAVPGRKGKLPPNPDRQTREAFRKALSEFGLKSSVLVPDGYDLDEFGKGQARFDFLPLIDHHNRMMSKSVMAMFIDLVDKSEGSYGLSSDQSDFLVLGLEAIMEEIAENITIYQMPKFVDWNFGSSKYPVFKFEPLSDEAKDLMRDVFKALAGQQTINTTKDFMFELEVSVARKLGLDINYDQLRQEYEKQFKLERENAIDALSNPEPTPGEMFKAEQDIKKLQAKKVPTSPVKP